MTMEPLNVDTLIIAPLCEDLFFRMQIDQPIGLTSWVWPYSTTEDAKIITPRC